MKKNILGLIVILLALAFAGCDQTTTTAKIQAFAEPVGILFGSFQLERLEIIL
ncbi:MAG: hypothetical protein MZU95_14250 [Desulfomicrobium escambiense]|nr:hypothetical protein [Desulfomicrobium escambiense]